MLYVCFNLDAPACGRWPAPLACNRCSLLRKNKRLHYFPATTTLTPEAKDFLKKLQARVALWNQDCDDNSHASFE